jgi:hypothetical protein
MTAGALAGILSIGCAAGVRDTQYPATGAQRAGAAMAQRTAARELDCAHVGIEPVVEPARHAADDGTECVTCERPSRVLGQDLLARGCGRELRFCCGGCGRDLSYCVSEHEVALLHCTDF